VSLDEVNLGGLKEGEGKFVICHRYNSFLKDSVPLSGSETLVGEKGSTFLLYFVEECLKGWSPV